MKSIKTLLREGLLSEVVINGVYYHGSKYPKLEWGLSDDSFELALFGYGIYLSTNRYEAIEYALGGNTPRDKRDTGYLFTIKLNELNVLEYYDAVPDDIRKKFESQSDFYDGFKVKFDQKDFDLDKGMHKIGNIIYEWDYISPEIQATSAWAKDMGLGWFLHRYDGGGKGKLVGDGLSEGDIISKIVELNDVSMVDKMYFEEMDIDLKRGEIFNRVDSLYSYITFKLKSMKKASVYFSKMGVDGFKLEGVGVGDVELEYDDYILSIINPNVIKDIKGEEISIKDKQPY